MIARILIVVLFAGSALRGAAQHAVATYRMPGDDQGILLSPSLPGEPYYETDGGGIREPNIYKVGDTYYLFYDGAATHEGHQPGDTDPENHLWRTHLAKSNDLKHWKKLGPKLTCAYDVDPDGADKGYKDFWSASSAWLYFCEEQNVWYMYYLGADGAAPAGVDLGTPAVYYSCCVARARTKGPEGIEGEWEIFNRRPGREKSVAFYKGADGRFPQGITVPGPVIVNPKWKGDGDKKNRKYMMFATCGANIAIVRSDDPAAVQSWDGPANPEGWQVDKPILGPFSKVPSGLAGVPESWETKPNDRLDKTAPENANYYYDSASGYHFLFTNQFNQTYNATDCNVVYWSRDVENWDDDCSAVVVDGRCTKDDWATGAIGFPSVVPLDGQTLLLVYDAQKGNSIMHTGRHIGYSVWKIPELDESGKPLSPVYNEQPNQLDL